MAYWQADMDPHAVDEANRWGYFGWDGVTSAFYNADREWYKNITGRPPYYEKYLREQFALTGDYTHLNVRINDSNMGTVLVNDVPPDFSNNSYTCWYFNDYTTTLVAKPKPGYKFVGWQKTEGTTLTSDTDTTTYVSIPANGSRVTAIFAQESQTNGITLSYQNGSIKVSTDITLTNAKLVLCSYSNEKLVDIRLIDVTTSAGLNYMVSVPSDFKRENSGRIKAYLWNNTGTIAPLADSIEISEL